MKTEVVIDGIRFVRACDVGPIKIVVIERGFVYVGRVEHVEAGPDVVIHGSRAIIRWGTTKHLGQLVSGPLEKTSLGDPCEVRCRMEQVIHMIEVSQDAWNEHVG